MSRFRLNRRTFMKLAGAAAGSAALSSASGGRLTGGVASAQTPPPRFLLIYAGGGWTPRAFFTRPSFAPSEWGHWSDIMRIARSRENTTPETSQFEFDFLDPRLAQTDMSRLLDPFWNMRSKMLAFEGLGMLSTGWDEYGDGHARNHLATMTGGPAAYEYDGVKSHPLYPSLDQRVLQHLQVDDPLHTSFNLNPNIGRRSGTSGFHYFVYGLNAMGDTYRLPTDGDPEAFFTRHFGGLDIGETEAERRAMAQREVFSRLQSQYSGLAGRLSGRDRMRIDAHRELLHELDQQLSRPRVACEAPAVGDVGDLSRAEAYEADWNASADMVAAGFGCGLTRVASLSLNAIPPEAYGLAPDAAIHHEYEHVSDPLAFYGEDDFSRETVAEEGMIQRNLYQARLVERLVNRLDQLPEMGGSVLDNTIVLYVSEMANGNHGSEYCPFVVFGGGGTGLNTGRYLKYPQDKPNPWNRNYRNEYTCTPHSQLYVSLLQRLGLDIDYIHQASIDGSVPHAGVTGTVNMSGPLAGV